MTHRLEGVPEEDALSPEEVPEEDALSPAAYWLEELYRSRGYRHIFVVDVDKLESLPHLIRSH